jgi:flagellar biosynthetic protein FliR
MSVDSALFWSFLLVFVRCSAMLLTSPAFAAQGTPAAVRVMTTLALAGALSAVVGPELQGAPVDFYAAAGAVLGEAVAGVVLGGFVSLAFSAFQMAGSILDLQIGMGASHVLNPVSGVPSTLLAQFKHLLAIVVLLCLNGHHLMLRALVDSYGAMPSAGLSVQAMQASFVELLGQACVMGIQIAAPVAAVGIVVDAALGIVNRAVPQMPVFLVGLPAKVGMGLAGLSVALPLIATGVSGALDSAFDELARAFGGGG